MSRRPASPYASSFSFGPGPISTTLQMLIGANVVVFVAQVLFPIVTALLGLHPAFVIHSFWIWQLATYMFLHGGVFHIVFNMLALWMFGAELERTWGTRYFLKFYFVTGIGAAVLTVLFSLLPFAIYFPERQILLIVFWVPARLCVTILGAIAVFASLSEAGGVANATHLGGLLVGYLYLKGSNVDPISEIKYRYLKWKINRLRKKFDVYSGGRADDWDRRVH